MKKNTQKRNYLIILTTLSLVLGIVGGLILKYILPQYYFSTYMFIPVYFYVFGFIFIHLFERVRQSNQNKTLLLYVSLRMMKLMVSIVILVIAGYIVPDQITEFLFSFIVFYLVYLIVETLFFFNFESQEFKRLKEQKGNKYI